jgi:hypothetical protein
MKAGEFHKIMNELSLELARENLRKAKAERETAEILRDATKEAAQAHRLEMRLTPAKGDA